MKKEVLQPLVSSIIQVDRGGHESYIGKLLAAEDDHITVITEKDGVVYYKTDHIKSLTHNAKDGLEFNLEVPEEFEFLKQKDFPSILKNLRYQWVKINRGGPETLEGVLDEVGDGYVIVILNEEIIRVSTFHIRSISYGVTVEAADKEEEENASDDNAKKENKK